ncbi:AI-2E family transporter [Abyssibacter profundi]|uniref:AI-2E family transporter n=1 Tax=Abyssibacter profundi TaxID=2182787 RepID=A0A363UM77_9GAMM|nr:AI-2E family transporter [Abyssibacter profundi]PWN56504.1 hypothetical protein DEH80_06645 [Abyssibacter profundi]
MSRSSAAARPRASRVEIALLVILLVGCVYWGRSVLLPIVLALLLNVTLRPVVAALRRFHLPQPAAAALVVMSLLGLVGLFAWAAYDPVLQWLEQAPKSIAELRTQARAQGDFSEVEKAREAVEQMAGNGPTSEGPTIVRQADATAAARLTEAAKTGVATTGITLILLYVLLATGDLMLRKTVQLASGFAAQRRIVMTARALEIQLARYLGTMVLLNLGVALTVCAGLALAGFEDPILWGMVAGLLRFIPYVGNLIVLAILLTLGVLAYEPLWQMVAPPVVYLAFITIYGNVFELFVHGRRLALNPVMLFVFVLFWGTVWGIPGALIAVPLLAATKVVAEQTPAWAPLGRFIRA